MRRQNTGFTLIEIMVVIVIVAIMVSAATLAFPPVGDKLLKEHAERFSALLSLAQDEAILQSNEFALEVRPAGYQFYHNENNEWQPYSDSPFHSRQFPQEISSRLLLDGIDVELEDRKENAPQIVFLSSGEVTPFTYTLQFKDSAAITLKVDANGDIERTQSEPAL